ncbi:MAG: DNA mismatch repair endonuclease MutL [Endomicrobium sp.]|jgi:DNA mismatch repair protein MutL|nr:DNA mismatch repair endonuclease MutL [Endomicrobium sp.]
MPINILSQETINKIAAGEVVERPLNVVKELVENSLDAFASSITVEIEGSGKKLIRVCDNGSGMDKKDLELSILRHATSKIENFEDLSHVYTMGFRGEALSSISAVSNFEIKTKKKGETSGWKLLSFGGKDIRIVPSAGCEGTITEVKDLFFNTPARLKFLKSDATERSRITDSLEETAIANPEISFKMVSDKKIIFSTSKTNNKLERISDILGRDFSRNLKFINLEHPKVILDIYFTGRDNSLANKKFQYLFVNSRPVNYPKWLIHCIYQAYKESIAHDRHPAILIYITIDPSQIDVNIHPAKREVKFADEQGMYDIICKTIRNALVSHAHQEIKINIETRESEVPKPSNISSSFIYQSKKENIFNTSNSVVSEPISKYNPKNYSIDKYANVFAKQQELTGDAFDEDNIKVLGQAFGTYIVVENKGDLYIFDQHAAAERIRYESYLSQIHHQSIKMQQLLIPETFDLPPSSSEVLKSNIELFNDLGISVEEFGQNSFRIISYPALLGNIAIEQIVKTIVLDIQEDKNAEIKEKREKIIRLSCRASIRAGDKVSFIETKKMINDLFKCDHPFTCPHGRPTAYRISLNELEKFFKRR